MVAIGCGSFSAMLPGRAAAQSVDAQTYHVLGVTAYDPAEVLSYAAQVALQREGRVTPGVLADTLEVIYREDGYFLAEVWVGDDGRTILVNEGQIDTLSIEGVDAGTFRLIRKYFAPVLGKHAVRLDQFERSIMLVEDIGSISATAEVEYPAGQENAHVRIVAREEDSASGYLTLDNPAREFGDAAVLTFGQQFTSALTAGDFLRFELSATEYFGEGDSSVFGAVTYRMPLGGNGSYGELYFGNVLADRDASGTLERTDIEGNTAILAFGHPVIRDIERYGYALFELRQTASSVTLPSVGFDADVDVLSASWVYGAALSHGGAWEYAANLSYGRSQSNFGGVGTDDETFWHLRAGLGYQRPVSWFGENSSLHAEFWGQYTSDALPAIEEFYLGGIDDERGYAFAEVQGDIGLSASIEVSRDLYPDSQYLRRIRPFGFLDAGYVKNNEPSASETTEETFASVGLGLDLEFKGNVFLRNYVAVPLSDGPTTSAGDPAFYLSLTKTW
ncbi:ShlB/FhaC/HecB family hemolysin secretion/activation protein [Marimonas sp. MJW-29]|uniref:ShlB/FhaC/HecB family hemolysin secretion/activation protein n=1 Tax=Sulfitobacter sediminis TaxID=3234186 RepID=A0ABV3RKM9_9RHOB